MNRLRRVGQNNTNAEVPEADTPVEEESQSSSAEATNGSPRDVVTDAGEASFYRESSSDYTSEAAHSDAGGAPVLDTESMGLHSHMDLVETAPPDPTYPDATLGGEGGAGDVGALTSAVAGDVTGVASDETPTQPNAMVKDQTAPLAKGMEPETLEPVPVGGLIANRYKVQNVLHHATDRNLYRVGAHNQQRCLTCGRLSPLDQEACGTCNSPLANQAPADFYLMAESYRPESLLQDPDLMQLSLYHPNLVPVIDFFSDTPHGRQRFYAVAEPRQGVRLSQLSLPRSGLQVLNWAMQLADALDYLHSQGVVGAGAEADDILVQGDRASLASLQNARAADPNTDPSDMQAMDLARLASTIYEAYTGNQVSMGPDGTLAMPAGTPEPVGAAFRAAIEPVQGGGRVITAAQWRALLASAMETIDELERPAKPVDFVSAGLTDVGRLREQNQDSFGMSEFVQASAERPMRIGFYMVADGLGGHKGGEIASALAVQAFTGEVVSRIIAPIASSNGDRSTPSNEAILQAMTRAVQLANERIYKARDNRRNDMGTTLVAAVVAGGKAYVVNVGDSRIYLYARSRAGMDPQMKDATRPLLKGTSPLSGTAPLRSKEEAMDALEEALESRDGEHGENGSFALSQVSIDHSLVHRLVELGQLEPEEAKVHPHRNFIYRSLGGPPPIDVDTFVRTLHPGDRLMLCSDGLNSMVEDEDIEQILANEPDPHTACRRLIDLANNNGGHDNITVIIVDVTEYLPAPEHPHALLGQ
ncbi:MAG: protein phosphatase 2C domain-containing protein [Chloroflexota bacterium]|nr:protein phosphatase 2C domain-containing protein [Chloroflexota bacterium]